MLGARPASAIRDDLDYIRRAVMRFRHDHDFREWRNGELVRTVNINALAGLVDTPPHLFYKLCRKTLGYRPSDQWIMRARYAVDLVLIHGLRFRRHGRRGYWTAYLPDGRAPVIPPEMVRRPKRERVGEDADNPFLRVFKPELPA